MGCGESKHAVATTESFSKSKRLNSSKSKKIGDNASDLSKDIKTPTFEKAKDKVSTNISTLSPKLNNKEASAKIINNEDVANDVDKNKTFDINKKEDEKTNDINVVETFDSRTKANEGDKKELHVKSQDIVESVINKEDDLSNIPENVNDKQEEKIDSHKSVESIIKEDEKSTNILEIVNDKQEEQNDEVQILEPIMNQEKVDGSENAQLSSETRDDMSTEIQSLPTKVGEESIIKEDQKSNDVLNDNNDEQTNVINDEKLYDIQEKSEENNNGSSNEVEEKANEENNNDLSLESHVDQLSVKENSNKNQPPTHDDIVKSVTNENVESLNVTNEMNKTEIEEFEKKTTNGGAPVSNKLIDANKVGNS